MYMMSGPPFKWKGNAVVDRRGEVVQMMGASAAIMHRLTTDPVFRGCRLVRLTCILRAAKGADCADKMSAERSAVELYGSHAQHCASFPHGGDLIVLTGTRSLVVLLTLSK
jgi:hypothetical protein